MPTLGIMGLPEDLTSGITRMTLRMITLQTEAEMQRRQATACCRETGGSFVLVGGRDYLTFDAYDKPAGSQPFFMVVLRRAPTAGYQTLDDCIDDPFDFAGAWLFYDQTEAISYYTTRIMSGIATSLLPS